MRQTISDPSHPLNADVEIIVARPYRFPGRHVVLRKTTETDGLNGYEGWHRHEDKADPSKWRQVVANVAAVRQMRANVWQNLAFYRPIDSSGPPDRRPRTCQCS